jgi:hypothetical protein
MPGYRFGKHPPKSDYRTLRFKDYLTRDLAPPLAELNVLAHVFDNLRASDVTKLFPMDGNERLGDCATAALAHAITVQRALTGHEMRIMTEQEVMKLYLRLTGGLDSGLDELQVMNHWRRHATNGDGILAFVKIDPRNHAHVQQAIQLFGGVYLGFQVQENCIHEFDAKQPWTPGRLTHHGHAVFAVGYDPNLVTVLTWGNTQQGSWTWWDECVDEAYAIVPPEATNPGFAPGFDIARLEADLNAVAS